MGFFDSFRRQKRESGSPQVARTAEALSFETTANNYEIASCHGKEALRHLELLRNSGKTEGFSAVLLGGKDDFDSLVENRDLFDISLEESLKLAAAVDVTKWLQEKVQLEPELFDENAGDWPSEAPEVGSIMAHLDILTRQPKELTYLAKIPTNQNWKVPAYIGMGGWNDCPDAVVLAAFTKRWHEQYGAEVVAFTRDTMEFIVAKPPVTKEAALALAREQYIFCSDIVTQGVGDVATLGATLLNSKYWYFWWD